MPCASDSSRSVDGTVVRQNCSVMARIIVGSYMVRYPLGGMMSWVLQYLVGFQRLGHEVYFVEKSSYSNACYNPVSDVMSDDCSYGTAVVDALLARFDLQQRWCFVDEKRQYHGLSRAQVEEVFRTADLFLDMGTHGAWLDEATIVKLRVLADGEPGFTQMKMENRLAGGQALPKYDLYYTAGANVGTDKSTAPTAGKSWRPLPHPVVTELFSNCPPPPDGAFTTVMNWQSHQPMEFGGQVYGQKDVEFAKFLELPGKVRVPLEVAVSGKNVPVELLKRAGWRVRDAHMVTLSFDSFCNYILESRGEFGVCKNVFVATNSGWFSDRSAAYLASGRPVVLQDTGFSAHLPCGCGLYAVRSAEEAAAALEDIRRNYSRQVKAAREIACEHLDAGKVLGGFLNELGIT